MNSKSFKKFKKWHSFNTKTLTSIPDEAGVYLLKYYRKFGRLKGFSDILYIGKSTSGLKSRLSFYFKPGLTQYTSQRVSEFLKGHSGIQISFVKNSNPRALEKRLIKEYFKYHRELPPLNRSK